MPPRRKTGPLTIVGERAAEQQEALFASPEEGASFIAGLTPEQKACRERRRHLYEIPLSIDIEPKSAKGPDGVINMDKLRFMTRTAMCACGARQESTANRFGVIIDKPKTQYSEGYVSKGIGRIPKEAIGSIRRDHWVADMLALDRGGAREADRVARREARRGRSAKRAEAG